jgi:hypothetical protein
MKFTDLSSQQRSMLTMLCTGQAFNTAELGRGCYPRADARYAAQHAAQLLIDLREKGLVFSSQKAAGQPYAHWRASDYGRDVFAGRPDEVVNTNVAKAPAQDPDTGTWIVYLHDNTATGQYRGQFISEQDACTAAAKLVDAYGKEYHVAKLVARVKPVQQPTFAIERV